MVEVALLFGLLSFLAQEGAVVFADTLAGPLVTVEEGCAVSRYRYIGKDPFGLDFQEVRLIR